MDSAVPYDHRIGVAKNFPGYTVEYEETRLGWRLRVEAYGKYFYFGSINYPDVESARIAALEFLDSLPHSALYWM